MNAIIRREEQQTALAPVLSLEDLKERATLVVRAGLAPKGMTAEALTVTMLKGQEMGMGPMEAMESFYVVNGSVGSWTHQLVSRLRQAGHDYAINESTLDKCTVTIYRRDGAQYTHTLTFKECEAAGYNRTDRGVKATWRGAGQRWMLTYRTISSAIKLYCPEVLHKSHQSPQAQPERTETRDLAGAWYTYTRQLIETDGLDNTLALVRQIAESMAREAEAVDGPEGFDPDVVDGEYEEAADDAAYGEPEAEDDAAYGESEPEPQAGNGQAPEPIPPRPYPPEILKRAFASRTAKLSAEPAAAGHRGAAVGAVENLFLGKSKEAKAAMRHAVGEYLFGKASSSAWTHGECQVLLDWSQTRNAQGEWDPNEIAAKEAEAIVLLMDKAAGQQELPL